MFASLRAKDSPAGWSLLAALGRFVCSSGKPVAEQGSKVDLPKGAVDLRSLAHTEVASIVRRGLPSGMAYAPGYRLRGAGQSLDVRRDIVIAEDRGPARRRVRPGP